MKRYPAWIQAFLYATMGETIRLTFSGYTHFWLVEWEPLTENWWYTPPSSYGAPRQVNLRMELSELQDPGWSGRGDTGSTARLSGFPSQMGGLSPRDGRRPPRPRGAPR